MQDEEEEKRGIAAAQRGDRQAFDRLVARYREDILRLCYRLLKNRADAEEAAQEVFALAWTAITRYEDRGLPLRRWLAVIATRHCLNRVRGRTAQAQREMEPLDAFLAETFPDPAESQYDSADRKILVGQIITRFLELGRTKKPPLDELDTKILLYRVQALVWEDIAARLGESAEKIKYRYYKRIEPVLLAVGREMAAG